MSIRDLVRRRKESELPVRRVSVEDGIFSFQHDMNRLFDDFFKGFGLEPFGALERRAGSGFIPRIDVAETDKEIEIRAELPGMDEKDVTVEMDEHAIVIRGEKKEEHEDKGKNWHRVETTWGSFHRVIPVPEGTREEDVKARFKKGVLTVTLPKSEKPQERRKTIDIKVD